MKLTPWNKIWEQLKEFFPILDICREIKAIDDKNLQRFKLFGIKVIKILFFIWIFIFIFGLFLPRSLSNKSLEMFGQLGDSMNIVTSLTGVFTVGLLAYAVYLQKTELRAVQDQIDTQTKSTEKEQKMNRTLKKLEESLIFKL